MFKNVTERDMRKVKRLIGKKILEAECKISRTLAKDIKHH